MRARGLVLVASAAAFAALAGGGVGPLAPSPAEAASNRTGPKAGVTAPRAASAQGVARPYRAATLRRASLGRATGGGGISCVPYVRAVTAFDVRGNGGAWWANAADDYARGHRPEPGAVFVFRAGGRSRLGHVAVVERQVGPREMLIHHANWAGPGMRRGQVMRGVSVVDVSDRNDWTAVRVQVGHDAGSHGSVYAAHGFIYDRPPGTPSRGLTYASAAGAALPAPAAATARFEEVAEAYAPAASRAAAGPARPVHVLTPTVRRVGYDLSVGTAAAADRR